jgi:hypothetical protein
MIGLEYLNNLYYIRDLNSTNYGEASLIVKSTINAKLEKKILQVRVNSLLIPRLQSYLGER